MPRVHPRLFWRARAINPLLPQLLPVCRDIRTSRNELRWLRDHVEGHKQSSSKTRRELLFHYVSRRSRGEPLQYIIGSEYFGDLEIKCRPGVLIPRQETAASVLHLVNLLSQDKEDGRLPERLKILDLCCGSGCISLLFCHEFFRGPVKRPVELDILGVDISSAAIALACKNRDIQAKSSAGKQPLAVKCLQSMTFLQADVLRFTESSAVSTDSNLNHAMRKLSEVEQRSESDIILCNPPYISSTDYRTTTYRSVRNFEPKEALVPPMQDMPEGDHNGDLFYPRVLSEAKRLNAKIVLFEVADIEQARRVARLAINQPHWGGVEIWRDDPAPLAADLKATTIHGKTVPIQGSGNGRSVLIYNREGTKLLGKAPFVT